MRALLLLLLAGCSVINYSTRPEDFPGLKITVHEYPSIAEVRQACDQAAQKYGQSISAFVVACSEWRFDTLSCAVHVPVDSPELLEHERAHCQGYDHVGESTIADAWKAYR